MADFSDEFVTYVKSVSALTTLLGSGSACRVYPDQLKQGCSMPALVFSESGGESVDHFTGSAGLCRTVLHTWAYGATRRAANELDETLRVAIGNQSKTMGSTLCTEVHVSSHRDTGTEGTDDATDAYRYFTHRVYDVWHVEATT